LEVLLSADDIGGDLAELYGYVNRALPDAELDAFVDALAMRIARSTNRPSLKRKTLSMLRASRPTQKLPPSGTHVLPLFSAPPPKRESIN